MTYTVTTLAERLNVSKEAATGLLRYLTEAGFATRLASISTGKRGRQPGLFTIDQSVLDFVTTPTTTTRTTIPTVNGSTVETHTHV